MNRWLLISLVLTIVTLGGTLFLYSFGREYMPASVPVHWDIEGKANQWVPRDQVLPYLLISPGAMVGVILLGLLLPWLSPKPFDVERFRSTYEYVLFLLVVLFAYIQLALLLATVDAGPFAIRMLIGGIFLFFTLLGNVLGKVRRNFWIGVRTPWTLANEYVWNQTHRVAAWLYTAIGILGLAAVLIGINLIAVFIVFMIGLLFPVPYSLYLYKRLQREGRLDSPAGSMS